MTELSPAAQAVLDSSEDAYGYNYSEFHCCADRIAAAALRAAADQVVPLEQCLHRRGMRPGGTGALSPDEGAQEQRAATRHQLHAIADELEAQ
jgi:hypothetical protein